MSTVSKITIASIPQFLGGVDIAFVSGDFATYAVPNLTGFSDEEIVKRTLERKDHSVFGVYGEEDEDIAADPKARVIYQA